MKKLFKAFDKLQTLYQSKREQFRQTVERFREKNSLDLYGRGAQLMDEADKLMRELKSDFSITAEGRADAIILKKKLKVFKETYKELHELTKPVWRQWAEAIIIALLLALILRNFIFGLYHVPTGSAEPNILVGDRLAGNKMAYYLGPVNRGDLVIFDNPLFNYDHSSKIHYLWQRYVGFPIPLLGLGTGPDNWVKRVIAIPGDVIEGKLENNKTVVYLNGEKLDEPYVNPYPLIAIRKSHGFVPCSSVGPFSIPSFLVYNNDIKNYTYDQSKTLEDQPYYLMKPEEIVMKRGTREPVLSKAYSPTLDYHTGVCVDVFGPYVIPPNKYWVMGDSRKNSVDSRWWLFLDHSLVHGRASFIIYSIDSEEPFWLFELIKHPINFWLKNIRWNRFFKGLNGYANTLNNKEEHYESR